MRTNTQFLQRGRGIIAIDDNQSDGAESPLHFLGAIPAAIITYYLIDHKKLLYFKLVVVIIIYKFKIV